MADTPKPAFKVKKHITCGFAPGEVRSADEFPPNTDFAFLVEHGAIRPVGDLMVPPTGDRQVLALMDQVEELTEDLGKAKDAAALAANQAHETLKARDAEIAGWKDKLVRAELDLLSAREDLSKRPAAPEGFDAALAAKDAEVADLQRKLADLAGSDAGTYERQLAEKDAQIGALKAEVERAKKKGPK